MRSVVILLFAVFLLILAGIGQAQAQQLDIYADKRTYRVGETVNICVSVNEYSMISIALNGPHVVNVNPFAFGPGSRCLSVIRAGPQDVGEWRVVGEACSPTTTTTTTTREPPEPPEPITEPPIILAAFQPPRMGPSGSPLHVMDSSPTVRECYHDETTFSVVTEIIKVTSTETVVLDVTYTMTETQPILTIITRTYYVVILVAVFVPWYLLKRKKKG
jgi:hypothetical protein